ncbi:MAG: enoyl-CoA hydratase/isomerase family protein [Candidatus Poribacteria bacterium]
MSEKDVKIVVNQTDGIITIQLNHPNVLNAVDREMLDALDAEITRLHRDESVRAVVLTGSGERAFCVGADLKHLATFDTTDIRQWVMDGNRVLNRLASLPVPVIAAINGYAIGGGLEITLACDLRIASDDSSFGLPEITHGWFPGWGGTHRLLNLIGEAKAKEMVFLGERVDAQTALNLGLVNRVVPKETLMAEVNKIAESLAEKSPVAVRAAKAALTKNPLSENGFEMFYEALALSTCFTTPEVKAGLEAFLNRNRDT